MANKAQPMASNAAMMPPEREKRPKCQGKRRNHEQKLVPCNADGFAVTVTGSLSSHSKYLCLGCVKATRDIGWKVTFKLEGDAALLPE